jgi:hypothetical protein
MSTAAPSMSELVALAGWVAAMSELVALAAGSPR